MANCCQKLGSSDPAHWDCFAQFSHAFSGSKVETDFNAKASKAHPDAREVIYTHVKGGVILNRVVLQLQGLTLLTCENVHLKKYTSIWMAHTWIRKCIFLKKGKVHIRDATIKQLTFTGKDMVVKSCKIGRLILASPDLNLKSSIEWNLNVKDSEIGELCTMEDR